MCGIAGFVKGEGDSGAARVIARMTDVIRHRGPDDSGTYEDAWVALGHRRLSIIDLAAGHQPMENEDGSAWIVFNGEIFNHADLRAELERLGHRFRTRCDTETILHAYEEYGPACLDRLRGMFAFAVWDRDARTLFCARDRLGKKPLYYVWDGRRFAFASEIKALLQHPDLAASLDASVLPEYLSLGYSCDDRTLFRGIRKLMPGHYLILRCSAEGPSLETSAYWDLPFPDPPELRSDESWIEECRLRLEDAVSTRLMSDVPLGVFLSGGVDSSAITAVMKRIVAGPVKSFSVGYAETAYSELSYARRVAQHLGVDYHEVLISRDDFFRALPSLIWHEDEPIVWPSSVSLYYVSRLAAEQVKVVLTGEGGDELFAGYARYRRHALNERLRPAFRLLPSALRNRIRNWIVASNLLSAGLRRKLGHTLLGREDNLESLYLDNFYSAFPRNGRERLLQNGAAPPYNNFLAYWSREPRRSLLERMLYADQKTYLVELLMKQDQMSMATSIESRVPLLDHLFVEFAARVPQSLKLRNGGGKRILKKAVEDLLPQDILYRKKMGFPTPLRAWLQHPDAGWVASTLLRPDSLLGDYLDLNAVRSLLERHQSGAEDATDSIWRLLNLQLWGDVFLSDGVAPQFEQRFAPLPVFL
ncbi:MAG: asparagine synthase (glutamine-hydrolyzing) [Bryobacteraceae bacterium]|nr:asparagine synthase (glutamine-hydrolyzing) [Bryobacteraceae bacterium]